MTERWSGIRRRATRAVLIEAMCSLLAATGAAQELTPRTYWPAPEGTKVAILGYSHATGDVVTDPSLPIFGVDSKINTGYVAYLQTLSLWSRTANILVELPYLRGTTVGILEGEPRRRDFSAVGDLGVTLSVNLLGAPSMTLGDFQELRRNPHPILGATVKVLAPTGRYEADKLINIGANRWAVKAELGYINNSYQTDVVAGAPAGRLVLRRQ
ncbi:MAG: hypothetical protein BMS9Abin37_0582 [Acidobacteriota bacterium]|nr:MAG: hypothetical protein BMS9Abin37_0582 [Acidobacteriota bacterium]